VIVFVTSFTERGYEEVGFVHVNGQLAGTLFAFVSVGVLPVLSLSWLKETYFTYSNPHSRLAVDQDSTRVVANSQSQSNRVSDLLDLLSGR